MQQVSEMIIQPHNMIPVNSNSTKGVYIHLHGTELFHHTKAYHTMQLRDDSLGKVFQCYKIAEN